MTPARYLVYACLLGVIVWALVAVRGAGGDPIPTTTTTPLPEPGPPAPAPTIPAPDPVRDLEIAALRQRLREQTEKLRRSRRRNRQLVRTLAHRSTTSEAIDLACAIYGDCATLWRRAGCETGGTFSPRSRNGSSGASGLFQFLPSTWATTPFARFSIWSPYANALAAGWMNASGRGGEWVCR